MNKEKVINHTSQFAIPILTIGGQIATSLKFPQWGLVIALASQPFWLYSSWKSYKQAGQIGMLVNTIVFIFVTIAGVINYWIM